MDRWTEGRAGNQDVDNRLSTCGPVSLPTSVWEDLRGMSLVVHDYLPLALCQSRHVTMRFVPNVADFRHGRAGITPLCNTRKAGSNTTPMFPSQRITAHRTTIGEYIMIPPNYQSHTLLQPRQTGLCRARGGDRSTCRGVTKLGSVIHQTFAGADSPPPPSLIAGASSSDLLDTIYSIIPMIRRCFLVLGQSIQVPCDPARSFVSLSMQVSCAMGFRMWRFASAIAAATHLHSDMK